VLDDRSGLHSKMLGNQCCQLQIQGFLHQRQISLVPERCDFVLKSKEIESILLVVLGCEKLLKTIQK